ncbi:zinc finger HIT domain-containing protein 2 [Iris pallida]|uniref:Zinc finger HIT domain-containing protein 2 n=1 Tax=Iris pallida TaxID=29817 RepID=A0AAX6GI59_IRIPA|nr:zinc finger HIT domain-containing protein 2 [Iris pallida]
MMLINSIDMFLKFAGNEIRVEDLSQEEIKQFQRAVASGELSKMIEPWNPWWKQRSAQRISQPRRKSAHTTTPRTK